MAAKWPPDPWSAMHVDDEHPVQPVPGSSTSLLAQREYARLQSSQLDDCVPPGAAPVASDSPPSSCPPRPCPIAHRSSCPMPLFSGGKLAAGQTAAQMPADVTWQAKDDAGHDGARSALLVANTALVPAAPAKTPPYAALRTQAQPVAAAPEVLRARPAFKVKRQRLPHATAASVATQPQLHAASSIAPRPSASDEDFTCVPSRFAGAASSTTAFFRPRAVIASAADGLKTGGALSCLLYTSPSPRDRTRSRMPSSA